MREFDSKLRGAIVRVPSPGRRCHQLPRACPAGIAPVCLQPPQLNVRVCDLAVVSMHVFLLNLLLLSVSVCQASHERPSFCSTTIGCVNKVKRVVSETNRFWFGDQHKVQCESGTSAKFRSHNMFKCLNQPELARFHSFGSRLFRVKTFSPAYLQNLRIFPRITYHTESGHYRACNHEFTSDVSPGAEVIEGHPDMESVEPFLIRNAPEISWPEMNKNDSLILAMVDVGFGTLRFLSINFPRDTQVVRKYQGLDNYRFDMPTPLALLVFRPQPGEVFNPKNFKGHPDEQFDLEDFMMKNNLVNGLIGLNWLMVGADAYAIERRRLRGTVDNCHSLVQTKLLKDQRWDFVDSFPLNEMDSSLIVSFKQPSVQEEICCQTVDVAEEEVFTDPIGDRQVSSIAVKTPPEVTSLRSLQSTENYQRSLRHYIVSKEDKFTLVMFDPKKEYLYWLISDIHSANLAVGNLAQDVLTIGSYLPPAPEKPNECQFVVAMLFRQPRSSSTSDIADYYNEDHPFRSKICTGHCIYRSGFKIEQFKAIHRLSLSALTWFKVCYDIHEAAHHIRRIQAQNFTTATDEKTNPEQYGKEFRKFKDKQKFETEHICTMIRMSTANCSRSAATQPSLANLPVLAALAFVATLLVRS